DVFYEADGAYTGAISAAMLQELRCAYCIIGHSERRQYFKETSAEIAQKAAALEAVQIRPILCVGEGPEVRAGGADAAEAFVVGQLNQVLEHLNLENWEKLVVAYEPIWSIGTGDTATPESAQGMAAALRASLAERLGNEVAERVRILYGGSLRPENAAFFAGLADIDGGLIGGASLVAEDFVSLVQAWIAAAKEAAKEAADQA
ncbi:MAG: triose-phosphate isomerase, partial [Coriobacteriia bacterium]|nr:triose-phosphate isomerase [Coriobacteriia bacterium]